MSPPTERNRFKRAKAGPPVSRADLEGAFAELFARDELVALAAAFDYWLARTRGRAPP